MRKLLFVVSCLSLAGCLKGVAVAPCQPSPGKTVCEEVTVIVEASTHADAGAPESTIQHAK